MARRAMVDWMLGPQPRRDTAVWDEELGGWLVGWERMGPFTDQEIEEKGGVFNNEHDD